MDLLVIPVIILCIILCLIVWRIYLIRQRIKILRKQTQLISLWDQRRELLIQHIQLEYLNAIEKNTIWQIIKKKSKDLQVRKEKEELLNEIIDRLKDRMTLRIVNFNNEIKTIRAEIDAQKHKLRHGIQYSGPLKKLFRTKEEHFLV